MNKKIQPLKKQNLGKKSHEKEDEIKRNLQMSNKSWNDWKFQIHWNKVEWVNRISCIEGNNLFCVYSNIFPKLILKCTMGC